MNVYHIYLKGECQPLVIKGDRLFMTDSGQTQLIKDNKTIAVFSADVTVIQQI